MTPLNLIGLSREELRSLAVSYGERPFRGDQLFGWIYGKRAESFSSMTDLARAFKQVLESHTAIGLPAVMASHRSDHDGTTKLLLGLADGLAIESVLIPPGAEAPDVERRLTLCLSTQVGCPLDCAFCATGAMGFTRNLTAGEIVAQVLRARAVADRPITNLVYMGMGEPMLNYENVMSSVDIIADERGLSISPRHITISTAGYADHIRRMADERRRVKLALSLHAVDETKRAALMPITKKHSVADLADALAYYYAVTRQRPTLEYIPFDGFNDTDADADLLVKFCRRVPCKVNLIPYHTISFTHPSGLAASLKPSARLAAFAERLRGKHLSVFVRSSAGEDIQAACGQLAVLDRARPRRRNAARTVPI